ncbi:MULTISPECIES: hypothetical protein [Mycobacterium avium complex (MAC)]|uniref:Uncharacterized protein n=1 Tax=Mycobacterium colombiense TaxID=339268 RepID=A0A329LVV3_9MYCO|nr:MULTISPECIES: hypothetical protein [Mycobacterium avium complex (MAC)]OBG17926.1 hypothetical protein A5769_13150 [Mycobacterium intracellulare]RAV08857.1 hypothetical protein DQP57_16235 [Mycobacterium colombiense]
MIAVLAAVLTCLVSWLAIGVVLASALSGTLSTKTGLTVEVLVLGIPALCVLIVGLLARRVLSQRHHNQSPQDRLSTRAPIMTR